MKKQYLNLGYTAFCHIVETYHDGVIQKREKVWLDELENHIEALEAEGYECAVGPNEFRRAKEHYEWCLEHRLVDRR